MGNINRKLRLFITILVLIVLATLSGYLLKARQDSMEPAPTYPTSTNTPSSQTPANNPNATSAYPGGSTTPINLQDCLNRVNSIDASQSVIDGFVRKCHEDYK